MPATTKASAVQKLQRSHLDTNVQMEALGGDLDVDNFHLQMRQGMGIDVVEAITAATLDRSTSQASALTVSVDDTVDRKILQSGVLGHGVDINLDGLFFTFVGLSKQGRSIDLKFEEREVNVLRRYKSFIFANRNQVTRAQFVLRMIREVQEVHLQWCIPELHIKQDVSDISGNQILIGGNLKPITGANGASTADATTAAAERQKGVSRSARLTVRGVQATREQIKNAEIILQVGESMKASRKVLISSIMVAIDESNIRNLPGGDRDSRGVFQQRPSQGWPGSRNVATDAAAYFKEAIRLDQQQPNLAIQMLCQDVQRSGTADGSNYAAFISEGTAFVDAYDRNPTGPESALATTSNAINSNTQMFMRGQITKAKGMSGAYVLTPENSWNCMQRLAQEVNWRCFVVSGVVYFISDHWLFKSKPFMTISEDSDGIDWIDGDFDEGKHDSVLTIQAHLSRWSAPPGSTIELVDMGPLDGKWLVNEVSRSLYDPLATITIEKPLPLLPEPVSLGSVPNGFSSTAPGGKNGSKGQSVSIANANKIQQRVVGYAQAQLGTPYVWGAEEAGIGFDCSGLAQAAYHYADPKLALPRVAQAQYDFGKKLSVVEVLEPGDLVFFGSGPRSVEHVGIYIGNGTMIDAPHTGARVRVDKSFRNWTDPPYVGATRPWAK